MDSTSGCATHGSCGIQILCWFKAISCVSLRIGGNKQSKKVSVAFRHPSLGHRTRKRIEVGHGAHQKTLVQAPSIHVCRGSQAFSGRCERGIERSERFEKQAVIGEGRTIASTWYELNESRRRTMVPDVSTVI